MIVLRHSDTLPRAWENSKHIFLLPNQVLVQSVEILQNYSYSISSIHINNSPVLHESLNAAYIYHSKALPALRRLATTTWLSPALVDQVQDVNVIRISLSYVPTKNDPPYVS